MTETTLKTKVDFYITASKNLDEILNFTCKLIQKAYSANKKIFINLQTNEQALQLNKLLWDFSDTSFLPHITLIENSDEHGLNNEKEFLAKSKKTIIITTDDYLNKAINLCSQSQNYNDYIIANLSNSLIEDLTNNINSISTLRVLEVVSDCIENTVVLARDKFKKYKEIGFEVASNDLRK